MIEDADPYSWHDQEIRTARKQHRCNECFRKIEPKEKYESMCGELNGDFNTSKTCSHCIEARKWLVRECKGFCWTGVLEDLYEHWDEGNVHTRELGRLIVGMRRKWVNSKGQLMPLPKVEEALPAQAQ
jgi:hypothetical protein